ncbi:MAG: N-6 DNA methylase [Hyphomicrobiaceae bacterium]
MAKKKAKKAEPPKTTAQQLGSLIKSARDIMRKDKGLNGDLDRLPLLTWIMFLKFLDDREKVDEARAGIGGKKYKPAVSSPYRWRDWAANKQGITGDELIAFVNQDEAMRPDGKRGPGLLAYLRGLQSTNGDGRRDVIATVFDGVINRMISGYLMRDVVNLVDGIHFDSSEEIHILARLYESMLREMRDAAGDSGEFYTPRPVIQFMVAVTDPQLGEVVLDPACGTGGFLAEGYTHLEKQCATVQQKRILQERSIRGGEAKPLPYMLSQMNLLLHGLDAPAIEYGNSLAVKITELGEKDRVDVILTNPPFGGEEERGILSNFPSDKQTSETALLFLQLIMRRLKRTPKPGRAAVVVPNGVLSAPGVAAVIRRSLLAEFRVSTIVRLPHNVFAPYTDIKTNLVFFNRSGPTDSILYCEPQIPEGTNLSKTKPLRYEWLEPLLEMIERRAETDQSWIVGAGDLDDQLNLDLKNPRLNLSAIDTTARNLNALGKSFGDLGGEVDHIVSAFKRVVRELRDSPSRLLGELTEECDERIGEAYSEEVRLLGVSNTEGFCEPKGQIGSKPSNYKIVKRGYLAYNPMRINIGSIGVALSKSQTGITSPDYVVFRCKPELLPGYVYHYLRSEAGRHEINKKTKGSVRFRLYYEQLAKIPIPVPRSQQVQQEFADLCRRLEGIRTKTTCAEQQAERALDALRREAFIESNGTALA